MRFAVIMAYCLSLIPLTGCRNDALFHSTVSFKGRVYYGHTAKDAGENDVVVQDGPLGDATVTCEGFPEFAKSAQDGSYLLTVNDVRRFSRNNSETYILAAYSEIGTGETITVTGKPGDTISVAGLIICRHAE